MNPKLLSVKKIWDFSPHNAFPDLIRFKDRWLCTFREGEKHFKGLDGKIRILVSNDGENWESLNLLQEKGIDLRDPKISIMPDGRLMLLAGGSIFDNDVYQGCQTQVAFSTDAHKWSKFMPILPPEEWLWRITWHDGVGYGASYVLSDPKDRKKEWFTKLWKTENGLDYELIVEWDLPGKPNETTIRFLSGEMIALVRREKRFDRNTKIGHSHFPYNQWTWSTEKKHLGGPNFIVLPDQTMWASGRLTVLTPYGLFEKTALLRMTLEKLRVALILPSGGEDCSYPGMVYHEGLLWLTYYSSHEGKSSIYLAKILI